MMGYNLPTRKDILAMTGEDALDEIIRGEISALETYDKVYEEVKSQAEATRIEKMKKDHEEAVMFWKRQAQRDRRNIQDTSGIWGVVVNTLIDASTLLGDQQALRALKKGEELGLKFYQSMLDDSDLSPTQKDQIKNKFIPNQEQHIASLEALIETS